MSDIEVGEVFTLSDENNEEQEVEVFGAMSKALNILQLPLLKTFKQKPRKTLIFSFLKVEEDSEFSYIENDEEFEKVSAAFEKILDEQEQE